MKHLILVFIFILTIVGCKNKSKQEEEPTPEPIPVTTPTTNAYGFNVLKKVCGLWNGQVTSTTPLGGFSEWVVDFRPIAENQVSAKNELDTLNDIFMSFFITKYNNQFKVAFRNGGSFNGMKRVSYFLADSVAENGVNSFYRFTEIIKGKKRAYTEVILKADSLFIKAYTNKYNVQSTATPHMTWKAKLQDTTTVQASITNFLFPKNTVRIDFTNSFNSIPESIFYSTNSVPVGDPYPETAQPYLGKANASYNFTSTLTPVSSKKVFLVFTTQPLFSGITFNSANLKYKSRYVILNASSTNFTFNYMHPGTYYFYAFYDNNSDGVINSGDWMSTTNAILNLSALATTPINTQINFIVP
ncbi:MAG: hypothetical protein LCH32_12205 [Bacteroidetes bacterium]|nr:hypothetical protein [Bacteroidota bacterium]